MILRTDQHQYDLLRAQVDLQLVYLTTTNIVNQFCLFQYYIIEQLISCNSCFALMDIHIHSGSIIGLIVQEYSCNVVYLVSLENFKLI